jgi:hypothetical protein
VLLAAICTIIPAPVSHMSGSDSHSERDSENAISPAPKTTAENAMIRPSPITLSRDARYSAPHSAPRPEAAIRKPSVYASPPSRSLAISGISTVYGMPTRLTSASSSSSERTGTKRVAYVKPSPSSLQTLLGMAPRSAARGTRIASSDTITAT